MYVCMYVCMYVQAQNMPVHAHMRKQTFIAFIFNATQIIQVTLAMPSKQHDHPATKPSQMVNNSGVNNLLTC